MSATRILSGPGLSTAPANLRGLGAALLTCGSIEELRSLAPLPDEAQRLIDNKVLQVGLERLAIAAEIMSRGLIYNLTDPLSVMELYQEADSKVGFAKRAMLPAARGENQLLDKVGVRTPIYATFDDFSINVRTLRASERAGAPLDVSMVGQATRRVNEAIEDATINGPGLTIAGNATYGLLNAPNAQSIAYESGMAWDSASKTGEKILADVLSMIKKLQAQQKYGPYTLFVPSTYGVKFAEDFKANGSDTIGERIAAVNVGGAPIKIVVADQLPANRTALVQMTDDVLDMIVGQEPTPLSWDTDGSGWERQFVILAFMIPRFKTSYTGQSGICLGFTS